MASHAILERDQRNGRDGSPANRQSLAKRHNPSAGEIRRSAHNLVGVGAGGLVHGDYGGGQFVHGESLPESAGRG